MNDDGADSAYDDQPRRLQDYTYKISQMYNFKSDVYSNVPFFLFFSQKLHTCYSIHDGRILTLIFGVQTIC